MCGASEKPKPGNDGQTTSNAGSLSFAGSDTKRYEKFMKSLKICVGTHMYVCKHMWVCARARARVRVRVCACKGHDLCELHKRAQKCVRTCLFCNIFLSIYLLVSMGMIFVHSIKEPGQPCSIKSGSGALLLACVRLLFTCMKWTSSIKRIIIAWITWQYVLSNNYK